MAEALRRLSLLKSELLSTVSHELRTPLTLIYGYAELLVHGTNQFEPAEIAQMCSEIYAGSQTLVRLVDDLLDFARPHTPAHRCLSSRLWGQAPALHRAAS